MNYSSVDRDTFSPTGFQLKELNHGLRILKSSASIFQISRF